MLSYPGDLSGSPLGEERQAWPAYPGQAARLHGVAVGMGDVAEVYSTTTFLACPPCQMPT